jgi:hypothetical protein
MSAGWVAGSARARLLLGRRGGRDGARRLAAGSSEDALAALALTRYGRREDTRSDIRSAQRAAAATTLFNLRLLAGWLPPGGVAMMRALAGWFELVNIEDRLAYLLGAEAAHPFDLGSLGTAWSTVGAAQSPGELRAALAASAWGDPGSEEPHDVHLALRLAWARRLTVEAPEARAWIGGALAVLLARERLLLGREPRPETAAGLGLGPGWQQAASVGALAAALPREAAWPLAAAGQPDDLWRAEVAWWARVERDAEAMVRDRREGRSAVVGAVALLAADARMVSAALGAAARAAPGVLEEVLGEAA